MGVCLPLHWGFRAVAGYVIPKAWRGCPLFSGLCVSSRPLCKWGMKIIGCFLFLPLKPWKQWTYGSSSAWDKKERLTSSFLVRKSQCFSYHVLTGYSCLSAADSEGSLSEAVISKKTSSWVLLLRGLNKSMSSASSLRYVLFTTTCRFGGWLEKVVNSLIVCIPQSHPSFPSLYAFLVPSFPDHPLLQAVFSHNCPGLHDDVPLEWDDCMLPSFVSTFFPDSKLP